MLCNICDKNPTKYKCPSCRINYCSAECWSKHKQDECEPIKSDENSSVERKEYFYETEDTVPIEKLNLLKYSKGLRKVLENRHVRDMLVALDRAQNPTQAMKTAMLEPIFVEFADECLKVVEPQMKDEW